MAEINRKELLQRAMKVAEEGDQEAVNKFILTLTVEEQIVLASEVVSKLFGLLLARKNLRSKGE